MSIFLELHSWISAIVYVFLDLDSWISAHRFLDFPSFFLKLHYWVSAIMLTSSCIFINYQHEWIQVVVVLLHLRKQNLFSN